MATDTSENEIFQYSIVSALMDGVASTGLPLPALMRHGDHGLGTFRNMTGEMIILDSEVYQMKSDGSIVSIDASSDTIVAPFAQITRFRPTVRDEKCHLPSKEALGERLSQLLPPARNVFVAFRADGHFRSVTVRTADGQHYKGEKLEALGKRQITHVLERETGTLIGFRSPAYVQGVSVSGDHFHFITADRKRGGHVLALEAAEEGVDFCAAPISKLNLQLPEDDPDFNSAKLELDSKGINAVEG